MSVVPIPSNKYGVFIARCPSRATCKMSLEMVVGKAMALHTDPLADVSGLRKSNLKMDREWFIDIIDYHSI